MFKDLVTDIFFDLDHTLWDFDRNSALTFHKIFSDHGIGVPMDNFLECYIPINLQLWKLYSKGQILPADLRFKRLKMTFDTLGYDIDDSVIELLTVKYMDHLCTFTHLIPNTLSILEYLKPNYRLHIITNGFQEVQDKKLKNAKIRDYFEHVVDSEMAGAKKPDRRIYEMALKLARVAPANALMIGDNLEADIIGAREHGLHALHLNVHGDPPHNYCEIIYDLHEIKSYL
ncbi:MAG: YjjG family noncanonical pyrimidine nucleotidase [Sediminicola sp.]|tara:strand:+ start:98745 stop:99434 length:690 start_codon:yes stop_codon:yes gene_type:complete